MAGHARAEREPGGGGRKKRGGVGGDGGGGDGANSEADSGTATTDATCFEVDGVVQESLPRAVSGVKLAANDSVLLANLGGKIGSPNDDFLSSIGTSKSQSVTTLEPENPERSFGTVLQELAAIQADGPRNVAILGTRHASYLHQQIIELLTYANVLVGNHVFTSGAAGTNYAVIKGALRAEKPDLLTVVLPQSMRRQPADSQTQLKKVKHVVELSKNDSLPLVYASQLCNSDILSRCTHFIAFAFHDSEVILESAREAKALGKVATLMYLD
ncbi:hypothetical protein MMPV_002542 [Pyropia vietnamensis]